jgi:hypothetical protein
VPLEPWKTFQAFFRKKGNEMKLPELQDTLTLGAIIEI